MKEWVEKWRWECFYDENYFQLWAVRNSSELAFTDAIHVRTKEEAEFLIRQLNKLRELESENQAKDKEIDRLRKTLQDYSRERYD